MSARTEIGAATIIGALFAMLLAPTRIASAQESSWFERLGIDRLRFTSLGAQVGAVQPHGIEPTTSWSLYADYGEITPGWNIVFTATYWGSRFKDNLVREYADSLAEVIDDPTGDATVRLGDVRVSDIALAADARRTYFRTAAFRPYLGAGIATHVVNADGRLIDGTFVERATDIIAVGIAGVAGVDVHFLRHIALGAQARYDFLSLARFASLRLGVSYYFDPTPRPPVR